MATKLIGRSVHVLDPKHAMEAQDSPSIPGERPKKKGRLEYISELIESGQFCRADFAYAKCSSDGIRYRVNGNHTSSVLCACMTNSEMPDFPRNVPLVIEEWECDSSDELMLIFDSYDNPQSNRTAGDRLGVHIAMNPDALDGCSRNVIAAALRGVNLARRFAKNPDEPPKKQWDIGELLKDKKVVDFCHFLQGFRDDSWQGWKDPGIAGAVFRGWQEDSGRAEAIWSECFDELDDNEQADSRKFANKMRTEKGRKQRTTEWFYSEALRYWKRMKKVRV